MHERPGLMENATYLVRLSIVSLSLLLSGQSIGELRTKSPDIRFEEPALTSGTAAFSATPGKVYQVQINRLRPLQSNYGPREVKARLIKFRKRSVDQKKKYIQKKTVDVTVGPDGSIYLLDGHHLARLLLEAGQPFLLAKIDSVHSTGSLKAFLEHLSEQGKIYLYEEENRISPQQLPKSIFEMKADPFRDLAWELQQSNDIGEVNDHFIEFEWSRLLFRKHISKELILSNYPKALEIARRLSHGDEARRLFDKKGYMSSRQEEDRGSQRD